MKKDWFLVSADRRRVRQRGDGGPLGPLQSQCLSFHHRKRYGARSASGDARKIHFQAVHGAAQVVPRTNGGSLAPAGRRLMLGGTARFGLERPQIGPLELKSLSGKTPVLDVGTLAKIKSGDIKMCSAIKRFTGHGVEFVDGRSSKFDAVVLATGYKSNVASWLKEREFFSEKNALPRGPFPNGWKGVRGLYALGFTRRGILGASMDAMRIADDIEQCWRVEAKQLLAFHCPSEQKRQQETPDRLEERSLAISLLSIR